MQKKCACSLEGRNRQETEKRNAKEQERQTPEIGGESKGETRRIKTQGERGN
jgi:hypothetical protein